MGHDITAYNPFVDEQKVRAELHIDDYDDEWSQRYRKYCKQTQVAYNRRSAGNPLNQVLYLALGVIDEAYAGCSGNGSELGITREQFEMAKQILETKSFADMERPHNLSDDVLNVFRAMNAVVVTPELNSDVDQERKFVTDCLAFMEKHDLETMRVYFG